MARELLTPREAARILGVTRRKLNQLSKSGRLVPERTVGMYTRFHRTAVVALAQELWGYGGAFVPQRAGKPTRPQTQPPAPEQMAPEPGYVSASEAAEILGVSAKMVTRWAKEGFILHSKALGGHLWYSTSSIEALRSRMLSSGDLHPQPEPVRGAAREPEPAPQQGLPVDQPGGFGKIRVPERLRRRRRGSRPRGDGLPDSAWAKSRLSEASKDGHRRAGPIMRYDDPT